MNDWQMAMQMYQVAPTPLAQRVPLGDNAGRTVETKAPPRAPMAIVRSDEVTVMRELSAIGWSAKRIGLALSRGEKTVRLYLNGTRKAQE